MGLLIIEMGWRGGGDSLHILCVIKGGCDKRRGCVVSISKGVVCS